MISVSPKHRIFLAVQPIDFRPGIDRITRLCQGHHQDPFTGSTDFVAQSYNGYTHPIICKFNLFSPCLAYQDRSLYLMPCRQGWLRLSDCQS